jgi:hypothetical protein
VQCTLGPLPYRPSLIPALKQFVSIDLLKVVAGAVEERILMLDDLAL